MKLWKKGFEEEEEEQDLHLREIFLFVQEMKPLLRRSLEGKQDRCSFRLVSREREREKERRVRLLRGFLPCSSEISITMRPRLFVPRTSTPRHPTSFLAHPRSRFQRDLESTSSFGRNPPPLAYPRSPF